MLLQNVQLAKAVPAEARAALELVKDDKVGVVSAFGMMVSAIWQEHIGFDYGRVRCCRSSVLFCSENSHGCLTVLMMASESMYLSLAAADGTASRILCQPCV